MNRHYRWMGIGLMALWIAGCGTQASTRNIEMDRVDRSLLGGNQGYIVGTPSSTNLDVGSREMMELELVLPTQAGKRASRTVTESAPDAGAADAEPVSSEASGSSKPTPKKRYYKK